MNEPTSFITEFVDLKAQYAALKESIDARIAQVLRHGQFIMGPEVRELEERLAAYTGAKHCVTCASGTEALLIALMALEIKPGDEVITTPFTFVATAEMIALLGAKPVFVDIEPDTCNIDSSRIEPAITSRTRAILPVSLYGQPADMDEINGIAARHGLPVIEDAAQSFGATYKGRKSCNLSTIGCTSFYPSKPLGCYGDGGALFTNDDALAGAMREIRVHGESDRYHHRRIGVGGRMDTLQCAVVLAKLERFEWEIDERIRIGRGYDALLAELAPTLKTVAVRPDRSSVYAQYTIITDARDPLQTALRAQGIPTAIHYPVPLHWQRAYRSYGEGAELSVSQTLAARVISLPMYPDLHEGTQNSIVTAIKSHFAAGAAQ
ncbi:MAG: aminotransferase DegT [Betaproteobacteria bacterium RIFCSPLOWO2_12_FULL_62_13]|nr:MAG: aminotransferase DegT [Betaproteobacteria bacterium RIFCSPLOWO2_12_FULL_62_13]